VNHFSVLLVDDDKAQLEAIEDLQDEYPGLEIHYASKLSQALDIIERHYLQLAVVDVSLRGEAEADTDGVFLLKSLRAIRPSCERILLTTIQSEDRREAISALAPARGEPALAQGLVDKLDENLRARELIAERARRWLHAPVNVGNLQALSEQLLDRGVTGGKISQQRENLRVSEAEVEFVLSRLFGQGDIDPDRAVDLVDDVEMHLISEGWSRSVVAWCEPRASKSGRTGPRCVVKIGPRSDAEQEIQRYRSYVRYGVALRYRVELLDHVLGDTVGAVCYSYGSGHSKVTASLQQMFDDEQDEAIQCLEILYDAKEKHLLADVTRANDLVLFFRREYGRDLLQLVKQLRRFVENQKDLSLVDGGRGVKWRDEVFAIPKPEEFGSGRYTGPYLACVVHGDLHGGNVLVADQAQAVLIDYRNMTRGPRLLDFASLETSLRMLRTLVYRPQAEIFGDVELERALWSATWDNQDSDFEPYWARVSFRLRALMRENFPDCGEWEYAATCLLRALRVFAASAVRDEHRMRLLIWISVLVARLRDLAAIPQS
jgi:CheY-like chemotaxis protein